MDFHIFFMISAVTWEAWGEPRIIENVLISMHFHALFSGLESVANPESSRIIDFHLFSISSSVEWEAWEAQNHSKYMDFHTCFMISSVEWKAWEIQNH